MTTPAIQVRDLVKQFGSIVAVDGVSFEIAPGELVGFLGQNGAGKSTTMRMLTTYLPASRGWASVAGFDVMYQSTEVRQNLGYLPENVPLHTEMRVEEYLQYRAKIKGVDRSIRSKRLDHCLDRCRITQVRRRLISSLSKGYRQRVGLADAMISDPKVLILDEPLTGLDPVQQEETLGAIKELGGKHTVLFSSHHLPDVEKICDRVIIIDRGRICFDGRVSEVQSRAPVLVVDIRGPVEGVTELLKSQPGVTGLDHERSQYDSDAESYRLKTDGKQDLRELIVKRVSEKGWGVRRLELRRARLEEVYMNFVFRRGTENSQAEERDRS